MIAELKNNELIYGITEIEFETSISGVSVLILTKDTGEFTVILAENIKRIFK
jgi:hypothetical protein